MKHCQVRRNTVRGVPFTVMAAALALLAACTAATGPRVPVGAIQFVVNGDGTWTRHSSDSKGFSVPITITNNWDRTVYLRQPCPFGTEQNVDGSWRTLPTRTICILMLLAPTPIAPGESLTSSAGFATEESSARPGQHRLIVLFAVKDGDQLRVLDHFTASSPFLVTDGN